MLKKIGEYVASFSVLIIVLGLIRQALYYFHFGIPIKYFMNLSEIGLIISDDLLFISSFFGIVILFAVLEGSNKMTFEQERQYHEDLERRYQNLDPKKRKEIKKLQVGLIAIHIILFISVLVLFALSKEYFIKLGALALFIAIINLTVLQFYKKVIYKNLSKTSFIGIITLSLFLVVLIFKTGFDIVSVERGKFSGTKIITSDTTYVSDKTSFFIGKTDKFVFIYNTKDSTTNIIPTESVKQILFKSQ